MEMKVMREMVQVQETSAATATLAALDQAWRQKVSGRWIWLEVAGGGVAALLFDWPGMGGGWRVCGSSLLWWGHALRHRHAAHVSAPQQLQAICWPGVPQFQGATRFKAMDAVFDDPAAMEGAQDPEVWDGIVLLHSAAALAQASTVH